MVHATRVALLCLVSAGVGCITVGEHFRKFALDRAAFEMQCPKEKLQLTGLRGGLDKELDGAEQVGVTGCGKRAVYVLTSNGWLLNSQGQ
jgi:hypothetical protein